MIAPKPVILRRPLPAMCRISGRFGKKFDGTLFESAPRTPVVACADSLVIKIGQSADNRNYVWLWCELPGVTCRVLYDGLGKLDVEEGDRLKVDDVVGVTATVPGFRIARLYVETRAFPGDMAVEPDFYDDYVDARITSILPESHQ